LDSCCDAQLAEQRIPRISKNKGHIACGYVAFTIIQLIN
jgi:hypothetical protein